MTTLNKKAFSQAVELLSSKLNISQEEAILKIMSIQEGMLKALNNGVLADYKTN